MAGLAGLAKPEFDAGREYTDRTAARLGGLADSFTRWFRLIL